MEAIIPPIETLPSHTGSHGRPQADGYKMTKKLRNQGPEPFKWGDSTFTVPQRISMEATQNEKHQYLKQTARALRDHESASWTDKAACFSLRLDYQTTHCRALLKLEDLRGHPETNCFNFLFIECAREDFASIAIPPTGLRAPFQNNCAFIACRVTINPIQAWAGLNSPPDPIERRVWIRILKEPTMVAGQSQFAPGININMIHQPGLLIQDRIQNHPPCPTMGGQSRDGDLDPHKFRKWWTEKYIETLFECEVQLLHDDYVGQGAMNNAANRLRKIKQEEIMPDGSRIVHSTDAHYQRVQALIVELPSDIQYGFSVTESFHNSLTQSIRDQIKADGVNLPVTAAMANVEQLDALSRYVLSAKNMENKIRNISRIINTSVGQNRGSKANVFLGAAVEHQDREQYDAAKPENFISDDPYQGPPHGFLTQTSQADVLYDMMLNEAEEAFQRSHCFLAPNTSRCASGSPVNAALTQASNMPYPLECWGCVNHSNPKQHAERYHPWRNYPHKLDPETANNAKQGLSDYYKSRDN
jgi:hypothetical protein